MFQNIILFIYLYTISNALTELKNENEVLKQPPHSKTYNADEKEAKYWVGAAQETIVQKLNNPLIRGKAKNVILFLGDGMSIATISAARIYLGQTRNQTGEETQFSFEKFPYSGLSKTYCVDSQVADSACSATAYLCGVKNNKGTIGVTAAVEKYDCEAMQNSSNHVYSIAYWSQVHGKRTGIVTTTRVTHASPAGVYAHTANRDWECDSDVVDAKQKTDSCTDIATHLIYGETGQNLNVILGGGRGKFMPNTQTDENNERGYRSDNADLIEEWKRLKTGTSFEYVSNRSALLNVSSETDFLLGLFEMNHTKFNFERDPVLKPSLREMTETAIRVLSRGSQGFFLFVEGGLIDVAHHATKAHVALDETIEFHKAIEAAVKLTNPEETLIVVTADHAHTMTLNGYPLRGNDIFGFAGMDSNDLPYTTLSYANGNGFKSEPYDLSLDDTTQYNYEFPALRPLGSETHGGDDVAIYAKGPSAHYFSGVMEQNVIAHLMGFASCVGDGLNVCDSGVDKLS